MTVLNEIKMNFPSKSVNEGFSRIAISAFSAQLDPPVDELSDVKTAVSEAVTNCIVHAYKNEVGKIEMCFRILEGGILYIKIKDTGCGIENVKDAMEPLYTTAPYDERAGLGFTIMESFMDKLTVRSKLGKGTTIIMQKKFSIRGKNE